jgi:hypothetical protein
VVHESHILFLCVVKGTELRVEQLWSISTDNPWLPVKCVTTWVDLFSQMTHWPDSSVPHLLFPMNFFIMPSFPISLIFLRLTKSHLLVVLINIYVHILCNLHVQNTSFVADYQAHNKLFQVTLMMTAWTYLYQNVLQSSVLFTTYLT